MADGYGRECQKMGTGFDMSNTISTAAASVALPNPPIAIWRLWLLRAGYLMLAAGMGMQIIPVFLNHNPSNLDEGIVNSMLLALVILSVLGLRYPLKMLPLLFWEMAWKTAWLISVALPLSRGEGMDETMAATAFACGLVVIIYAVVPWDYVWRNYVTARGNRWF